MNKIVKSVIVAGVIGGAAVAYCNRYKISKAVTDAKKEIERRRKEQQEAMENILADELAKAFGVDPATFRAYGNPQSGKSTGSHDQFWAPEFGNFAERTAHGENCSADGKGV